VDRYWFFTWRTYGTWLPGEPGFVGHYVTTTGQRVIENVPSQPTAEPMPPLADYARSVQLAPAVYLTSSQANTVQAQLLETATYRGRQVDVIAVLTDHVHIVFGAVGDPDPDEMLSDWKAYASRALNRLTPAATPERQRRGEGGRQRATRPRWWAEQGSTRPLKTPETRCAAIRYVRDQENPLVVWLSDEARLMAGEPGASATAGD
jgi:hypothetical protein